MVIGAGGLGHIGIQVLKALSPAELIVVDSNTRNEPGNMWYDWSRSLEDPSEYVLVEGFRDGDAGKEHVSGAHFKKFIVDTPALLASTPQIISQTIDATGWSEMGEMTVA